MPKNTRASKWLLFWLAPSIPFRHAKYKLLIWISNLAYRIQTRSLSVCMKMIGAVDDLKTINQPQQLFLAISEANKELKLSGFYAETPEQYKKEHDAVPGDKLIVLSMAELRENIIKNFMERRFYNYQADVLAKNGGHYVH